MENLPKELTYRILDYTDIKDCISLSQTCSRMRDICLKYITIPKYSRIMNNIFLDMRKFDFYDYDIIISKEEVRFFKTRLMLYNVVKYLKYLK